MHISKISKQNLVLSQNNIRSLCSCAWFPPTSPDCFPCLTSEIRPKSPNGKAGIWLSVKPPCMLLLNRWSYVLGNLQFLMVHEGVDGTKMKSERATCPQSKLLDVTISCGRQRSADLHKQEKWNNWTSLEAWNAASVSNMLAFSETRSCPDPD